MENPPQRQHAPLMEYEDNDRRLCGKKSTEDQSKRFSNWYIHSGVRPTLVGSQRPSCISEICDNDNWETLWYANIFILCPVEAAIHHRKRARSSQKKISQAHQHPSHSSDASRGYSISELLKIPPCMCLSSSSKNGRKQPLADKVFSCFVLICAKPSPNRGPAGDVSKVDPFDTLPVDEGYSVQYLIHQCNFLH